MIKFKIAVNREWCCNIGHVLIVLNYIVVTCTIFRPTVPPAQQANKSLLLKAMTEARDSIAKATQKLTGTIIHYTSQRGRVVGSTMKGSYGPNSPVRIPTHLPPTQPPPFSFFFFFKGLLYYRLALGLCLVSRAAGLHSFSMWYTVSNQFKFFLVFFSGYFLFSDTLFWAR